MTMMVAVNEDDAVVANVVVVVVVAAGDHHHDTHDAVDTVVVVLDCYYHHVHDDPVVVVDSANAGVVVVVLHVDKNSVHYHNRVDRMGAVSFHAVVVVRNHRCDCDRDRTVMVVVDKNDDHSPFLDCDEILEAVVDLYHNLEVVDKEKEHCGAVAMGLSEEDRDHHHHLLPATCCCCWVVVDAVHRDNRVVVVLHAPLHVHCSHDLLRKLRVATVAPIHVHHHHHPH